jgi:hypothetical protein
MWVTGQHSSEVSKHLTTLHLYKLGLTKLCAWVDGFILQNVVFIWSLWLKNVINTIYFVIQFKCDLNPTVSIIITV